MYPGMNVSRSLGDLLGHHIGVKSQPSIEIHDLTSSDKYLTIATDALWSSMCAEDVGEILADCGKKNVNCTELIIQRLKAINNNSIYEDTSLIISALTGIKN